MRKIALIILAACIAGVSSSFAAAMPPRGGERMLQLLKQDQHSASGHKDKHHKGKKHDRADKHDKKGKHGKKGDKNSSGGKHHEKGDDHKPGKQKHHKH